jgi:hypothetical protein
MTGQIGGSLQLRILVREEGRAGREVLRWRRRQRRVVAAVVAVVAGVAVVHDGGGEGTAKEGRRRDSRGGGDGVAAVVFGMRSWSAVGRSRMNRNDENQARLHCTRGPR